jgi:hypothetical protein
MYIYYNYLYLPTRSTFAHWLSQNRRSGAIVGAWSRYVYMYMCIYIYYILYTNSILYYTIYYIPLYRPLFCGGWGESTDTDTLAFNLQTPSFFMDLRCPTLRPSGMCVCLCAYVYICVKPLYMYMYMYMCIYV